MLRDVGLGCLRLVFRREDVGSVVSTGADYDQPGVAPLHNVHCLRTPVLPPKATRHRVHCLRTPVLPPKAARHRVHCLRTPVLPPKAARHRSTSFGGLQARLGISASAAAAEVAA
jgi:hypothetical protein